jgi:hypothetical protein
MTSNKNSGASVDIDKRHTVYVTADMVLDLYAAALAQKNKEKKQELLTNATFLSKHLNTHLPLRKSQYLLQ